PGIIQQYREREPKLLDERAGLPGIVLRNSCQSDPLRTVGLMQSLEKRKRILASWTRHFEERQHDWPTHQFVAQRKPLPIQTLQFEFRCFRPARQCRHGMFSASPRQEVSQPAHKPSQLELLIA